MTKKREFTILSNSGEKKSQSSLVKLTTKKTGKEYWRSLEELAETPEFQNYLHREFPENASEWSDPKGRRHFLKLMGASLALAGISTACTVQPEEKLIPYTRIPENMIPGKALFFATAMNLSGAVSGLLVESHEGRPTKVEGNPDHPNNHGSAGVWEQASVLNLYDPDRLQAVSHIGVISNWSSFIGNTNNANNANVPAGLKPQLETQKALQGAGLRILTGAIVSPTMADQFKELKTLYPQMKVVVYEPVHNANALNGAKMALGEAVAPVYSFDKAEVIFSIDSDFLSSHPGNLKYIRDFVNRRRLQNGNKEMSRFYAIETMPSNTGAKADHRLPVRASDMEAFTRAVAAKVGVAEVTGEMKEHDKWISVLAEDLKKAKGKSLIIAGAEQPPMVHALAHAMNSALGNFGNTVSFVEVPEEQQVDSVQAISELVGEMNAGKVDMLLMLGGNPVYDAPVDLDFVEALKKVNFTAHLTFHDNETSAYSQWVIPETHYLESWSDARSLDGTVSIIQPLIEPMYQGKSAHELLDTIADKARSSYDIVKSYWATRITSLKPQTAPVAATQTAGAQANTKAASAAGAGATQSKATSATVAAPATKPATTAKPATASQPANAATPSSTGAQPSTPTTPQGTAATAPATADSAWRKALNDGIIAGSVGSATPKTVGVKSGWANQNAAQESGAVEIVFRADPSVYDGRFGNNGWLQELPKPLSKLTWDNAAHVSPAFAKREDLRNGDVLKLKLDGRDVDAPVWVMPGQVDKSIVIHLGYGRTRAGNIATGVGFDAYKIRPTTAQWFSPKGAFSKTGNSHHLVTTQDHWSMEGRELVRDTSLEEYTKEPAFAKERVENPAEKGITLYPQWDYSTGYKWGMSIDLNNCVGCNACVVACVSENNIPVVGKSQVDRGREMQWLRVDRYYKTPQGVHENEQELDQDPELFFQPVPCMQCENAPCEVVCPVAATSHSAEGLNDMVYNRCVGTRYCSNNCPYKVRRFNFLLYQDFYTETYKFQRNPDVSVRSRGVMEKCTYCVQRIQEAKIEYEKLDKPIPDGAIVTACQQTCPADAIVFGNLNDPNSRVAKLKQEQRNFGLLEDLNTRPRTTYLAEVRNPHAELKKEGAATEHHG